MFSSLNASSNNAGAPAGAAVNSSGIVRLNGAVAPFSPLTIEARQTEFTSPSGPGTLTTTALANFILAESGSLLTATSSLDATSTALLMLLPGSDFGDESIGAVGNVSGYTLSTQVVINLAGPPGVTGASSQFASSASFIVSAVPEPFTLISGGLAGAVGLGLAWRRRRARTSVAA